MAWESSPNSTARHSQLIDLSRMIARFHHILITPDSETEARLRGSGPERAKVGANLKHAGEILANIKQENHTIHGQILDYDYQRDLAEKQQALLIFTERLQELNDLAEYQHDASDEEDLLEKYSSSPLSQQDDNVASEPQASSQEFKEDPPASPVLPQNITQQPTNYANELESNLRARFRSEQAELFLSSSSTKDESLSATAESLLTHNRSEQENLTSSLLHMASILKSSSLAFSSALEEEKNVLKNTTQGLSKNERGLEATQRRMGLLRKMTEGKGWWGRMLMYAWIFGLAVVALLIVFLIPKLRF